MSAMFPAHDKSPGELALTRAVFIDKDGTLVEELLHNVDPARLRFTPHAVEALKLLREHGYELVIVSNQPGLAFGEYTRAQLTQLQLGMREILQGEGVHLTDFYACTHAAGPAGPVPGCLCRRPAPGLLRQAARAHSIDLQCSWMVGDLLDDVEAGRRAGCRTILLDVGHETAWRMSPLRTPHRRAANLLEAAQAIVADDACDRPHTAAQPADAHL